MSQRLLVIGGDAAGMAAASHARRLEPYMEIVALERGTRTSYSACGVPYLVGGQVADPDDLVARTPEEFRDNQRIDVRIRHEAMSIDLDANKVEVRDHSRDRTFHLGFDLLHIATGASPVRPDLPGIDQPEFVYGVQTVDDGARLLDVANRRRCQRVVIVGGGYIGIEMAEAFTRWGADVVLIDGGDQLMATFDVDMAAKIQAAVVAQGVDVRLATQARGFENGAVQTDDGDIPADLVVLGLGVSPNSGLAEAAGIDLGARHAIVTDRRQRTATDGNVLDHVYSAGDCAQTFHRVSRRPIHIALGTVANKTGRVAGINIGGGYAASPGVVGTAISKLCGLEMSRTGLTEREAVTAGFDYEAVIIESTTTAGYLPEAESMTMKLLVERVTDRIIGAQIVGGTGAAKRIDALATVVTAKMTAADVVDLDWSYAPPYSGVWEVAQVAARKIADPGSGGR